MGCDGLQKILLSAVEYHDLLQYFVVQSFETSGNGGECQPKVVAFDASIWMYQADRAIKHGNADAGPNPQLRILFYRAARLLSLPICVVFVFDGPARPAIKRGTKVLTHGHWLTGSFQKLIEAFGYHWYMAPGEAEAEMAQLSAMGVIDIVVTTDTDALIFGAKNLMIFPNKKKDNDQMALYTSENIFITPDVALTRGGLLLIALLAGGDYHEGVAGCGIVLAHAVARGTLGDSLLREALVHPATTPPFMEFLRAWKATLSSEFATDPHGHLGRRHKAIAAAIDRTSFPDLTVLRAYTHPITSWSPGYSSPPHQSWGLARPELERMASFCQRQFGWDAAEISCKFIKLVYPGIALQSLLQPYDLHALLEAHVNSGFCTDNTLPRSSVLQVHKEKTTTSHGTSIKYYQVEISTGALSLQAKSRLRDATAFPTATLMRTWIPAPVIDYALPDLVSRSKASAKHTAPGSSRRPKAFKPRIAGPSIVGRDIIDLTTPEPEDFRR
ncbi:PIN domain-like protein [Mycena olivaceomarginata]|nr:PIN domain-like protein [Mycena olivaceomarginata]